MNTNNTERILTPFETEANRTQKQRLNTFINYLIKNNPAAKVEVFGLRTYGNKNILSALIQVNTGNYLSDSYHNISIGPRGGVKRSLRTFCFQKKNINYIPSW